MALLRIWTWLFAILFQIRTWLLPVSMSRIWTWLLRKFALEAEQVAGRFALLCALFRPPLSADQTRLLQLAQVRVQRSARDFGIGGQLVLRRIAPEIRRVPVAKIPEDKLGRGHQPALLDRPVGGFVAHSAAVTVRRLTMAAINAMRLSASSWRIFPARTRDQ